MAKQAAASPPIVQVNEAYQVLSDEAKRQAYDDARRQRASTSARPAPPPRPRPRETDEHLQILYCQQCGARNRIEPHADLSHAFCGKCRAPLARPITQVPASRGEIRLERRMDRRLKRDSEVRLHPLHLPEDRRCVCLRCHFQWTASSRRRPPSKCPNCRSPFWSDFRLFLCRHCREQFQSASLYVMPMTLLAIWPWPYWLFPTCPACGRPHWHTGCERHPLRGLLNLGVHAG